MSFGKLGALGRGFGRLGSAGKSGAVLNLSNASVSDAASIGDLVGVLSVSGGTGSYTYSITSDPSSLFAIDTANLEVGASLTAGSYPVTIQANNGAGSIISRAFLITVTHATGMVGQPIGLLLSLTYAS